MGKFIEVKRVDGKLYSNKIELYSNKLIKVYTFHKIKLYIYRKKCTVFRVKLVKNVHLLKKCTVMIY